MFKKDLASKIFLFLVTAAAIFMTVSGLLTSGGENLIFQLLFLPVTIYLIYASLQAIKHANLEVILSQKKGGLFFYLLLLFALALIAINNISLSKEEVSPVSEEETTLLSPSPTPISPAEKRVIIETPDPETKINVREAPSTTAEIIGKVGRDEEFIFIQKEKDWYQVEFEGRSGYIHQDYITVLED